MEKHLVVGPEKWEEARKILLVKEKELTRARDALAAARRELPWERVEKSYVFDASEGEVTLGDLFAGRSQLIVYHFMFAPDWENGCKSCSFWADNFERNVLHLEHRDASFVAISRAPVAKLEAFKKRFGWTFRWVSSGRSDFNQDYHVSFEPGKPATYNFVPKTKGPSDLPGISVFHRDVDGAIHRTYSTYARGVEVGNSAFGYLDLLPKGRDEHDAPMGWLRLRDQYDVPA
ncbi:MAG: hypothetical protein JWP97_6429 [Labilithrix sp.]|nr:hypothetical protein [Labilithrix sp.]